MRTKEQEIERLRIYAKEHPEVVAATAKRSRERRKDKIAAAKKRWQQSNPEKVRDISRRYRLNHPDRVRATKRKTEYGITQEEFDHRRIEQNNKCVICLREFVRTPHIDHDHITGEVRALLCGNCNPMLGHARDDISVLRNAIAYLEKFRGVRNGGRT